MSLVSTQTTPTATPNATPRCEAGEDRHTDPVPPCEPRSRRGSDSTSSLPSLSPLQREVQTHPGAYSVEEADPEANTGTEEGDEEADVCLVPPRPFFFATDDNTRSPSPVSSSVEDSSTDNANSRHSVSPSPPYSEVEPNTNTEIEKSTSLTATHVSHVQNHDSGVYPQTQTGTEPRWEIDAQQQAGQEIEQIESQPQRSANSNTDEDVNPNPNANMPNSNASYSPLETSPPLPPASSESTTPPSLPPKPTKTFQSGYSRPPPSSFAYTYAAFPFQAYPGNPDPGLSIPGFTSRRRASLDSYNGGGGGSSGESYKERDMYSGSNRERDGFGKDRDRDREDLHSGSLSDLRKPFAPFMAGAGAGGENNSTGTSSSTSLPRSNSSNSLYKQSAAGNLNPNTVGSGGGGQGQSIGVQATQGLNQGQQNHNPIPRNASTHSFRAPFLAPSSRPTSSLWSPPTYTTNLFNTNSNTNSPNLNGNGNGVGNATSPNGSTTALAGGHSGLGALALTKSKPPLPSTLLRGPIPLSEKTWLGSRNQNCSDSQRTSLSYCLTLLLILLGAIAASIQCYTGLTSVNAPIPAHQLCTVMDESFPADGSGGSVLDTGNWNVDLELTGYGNGEFEMSTSNEGNIFVKNGELYIMPTVTSDSVQNVLSGGSFTLEGCMTGNSSDGGVAGIDPGLGNKANGGQEGCTVTSNDALGTVINPVQSARINTRGKKSIRFGKVEVKAKLPKGDWLWPQIFLLPSEPSPYGAWPVSGELDLLLARGNDPSTYPAQGNTVVRSSLSFGPLPGIASSTLLHTIFGYLGVKHPSSMNSAGGGKAGYPEDFHVYTMEWTEEFIRFSVDKATHTVLEVSTRARKPQFGFGAKAVDGRSYWNQAGFPEVAKGVGGGGGGGSVSPDTAGNGTATGNSGNSTASGGTNSTDTSGNNSTSATNGTNSNTNSTFPRSLSALSFPVINNSTRTNSSSSASPSPSVSSNSSTNPNTNGNGVNPGNPDNITPILNPYTSVTSSTPAAPFDQPFYLVVNLAVGGTSGWFPDGVGGKMWFDGSSTAMRDFARAQDTWYKTWPASTEDRALRIDYVKMWELC